MTRRRNLGVSPEALLGGGLLDSPVVVTFSGSYADNLHNAEPTLKRHSIPVTVFLTTGYIGGKREFWWDELELLSLRAGTLPEVLCPNVNGSTYRWELGEAACYSEDASRRYQSWRGFVATLERTNQT